MNLLSEAQSLVTKLQAASARIVLAESCTAGLAAASLARIPGASDFLTGSSVVYRDATKVRWLGISERTLDIHTSVSKPVTDEMARAVLARTPEADYSAAITGHLGPDAPSAQDGTIFMAVAKRADDDVQLIRSQQQALSEMERTDRQREAARELLRFLWESIID